MSKICLFFSEKDFEYDVYSLVRAFYPKEDVQIVYDPKEAASGEFERLIEINYDPGLIHLEIRENASLVCQRECRVDRIQNRSDAKNELKRMLYLCLKELTGRELPWGNLTGIRPTKIVMKMIDEGIRNPEIASYMRDTFFCSREKTALAIAVANREKALIQDIDYQNGYSLYVGIPFCPSICLYCSFGSHPISVWKDRVEAYLQALFKELSFISKAYKHKTLHTIYVGGGTPSSLSADQLRRLLAHIVASFDLSHVVEFTVEAGRPDSIDEDKLEAMREFPVTRISINPQTMQQKTLDLIGRKHTVEEIYTAFHMAREKGFHNINMDLIVGLPGEGYKEVEDTLNQIKKLDPEGLTVHSLALKRATRLNLFKDQYQEISFENSSAIMDMTAKAAWEMDMQPYYLYRQKNIAGNFENVGYAKVDNAGIYNILIMEEKQTIMAAGVGATTKFVFDQGNRIERVDNVKDVSNYISRIDEMLERKEAGIEKWQ